MTLPPGTDSLPSTAARVDEGYFDTIGIPIVSGRGFRRTDTADAPRVAIVSRGMAARYWPDENPLGKRIRLAARTVWAEIVGVAADAKFRLFTPDSTPFLYLPRLQNPSTRSTLIVQNGGRVGCGRGAGARRHRRDRSRCADPGMRRWRPSTTQREEPEHRGRSDDRRHGRDGPVLALIGCTA